MMIDIVLRLQRVIDELKAGFVVCESCGEQEDTATLDCVPELEAIAAVLAAVTAERDDLRVQVEAARSVCTESQGAILGLIAERDQVRAEVEALRKDAERYRWLRMANWWHSPLCVIRNPKEQVKPGSDCPSGNRLDEAVDAAMATH